MPEKNFRKEAKILYDEIVAVQKDPFNYADELLTRWELNFLRDIEQILTKALPVGQYPVTEKQFKSLEQIHKKLGAGGDK